MQTKVVAPSESKLARRHTALSFTGLCRDGACPTHVEPTVLRACAGTDCLIRACAQCLSTAGLCPDCVREVAVLRRSATGATDLAAGLRAALVAGLRFERSDVGSLFAAAPSDRAAAFALALAVPPCAITGEPADECEHVELDQVQP